VPVDPDVIATLRDRVLECSRAYDEDGITVGVPHLRRSRPKAPPVPRRRRPARLRGAGHPAASGMTDEEGITFPVAPLGAAGGPQYSPPLFGGSLLRWLDEEAAIYAIIQLGNPRAVTKYMSAIDFVSSAGLGKLLEIGLRRRSIWPHLGDYARRGPQHAARDRILTIDRIVFVGLDERGAPPVARLYRNHLRPGPASGCMTFCQC
jgi:acyl-CoA thioesterase YciA